MSRKQFKKSVLATFSGFVRTIHLDVLVLPHRTCSCRKFPYYDHCIQKMYDFQNVSVQFIARKLHMECAVVSEQSAQGAQWVHSLVGAASVGKVGRNTHAEPLGTSAPRSPWTPIWPTSSFSWIWMSYIFSTGANIGDGDSTGQCCCCASHLVLYQLTHKLWPSNTSPPNIAPGSRFSPGKKMSLQEQRSWNRIIHLGWAFGNCYLVWHTSCSLYSLLLEICDEE